MTTAAVTEDQRQDWLAKRRLLLAQMEQIEAQAPGGYPFSKDWQLRKRAVLALEARLIESNPDRREPREFDPKPLGRGRLLIPSGEAYQ